MESISKEASIDSCVVLRLLKGDNLEQWRLVRSLLLNGQDFYVDEVVIMEVVYVLTRDKIPRSGIIERLLIFLKNPGINYDYRFFDPVFEEYVSHPSLSFDDCVLTARIAMKRKEPLWTLDRKLANQSSTARHLSTKELVVEPYE